MTDHVVKHSVEWHWVALALAVIVVAWQVDGGDPISSTADAETVTLTSDDQ